MYSLVLTLALVGGLPPTDKSVFDIVGSTPPVVQTLSLEDFRLTPKKEKPVEMPKAATVVPQEQPPVVMFASPSYVQAYNRSVPPPCATGNCPTYNVYSNVPAYVARSYPTYGTYYTAPSCTTGSCPTYSGRPVNR